MACNFEKWYPQPILILRIEAFFLSKWESLVATQAKPNSGRKLQKL